MPAGYGIKGHFGLGRETTWGTAVSATLYAKIMNESFAPSFDRFDQVNVHGGFHEPDDAQGVERLTGQVAMAANPHFAPHLFRALTGQAATTTSLGSGLFSHVHTLAASDTSATVPYTPYTIEINRDVTSSQRYDGCVLDTLELRSEPNAPVMLTAGWIGRASTNITAGSPTFAGSPAGFFDFSTASIQVAGAVTAAFESFVVNWANNIEGVPTLANTRSIGKIRRTNAQFARFQGAIGFEDITEYTKFLAQSEMQVIGSWFTTNSFLMVVELPRVVYTAMPLGMSGRGRQLVTIDGIARYHTGSGNAYKVTINNVSSSNVY